MTSTAVTAATAVSTIDPAHFRSVMRHLPTGVAAVCSTNPRTATPCGLIVGTFASLSLDPPWVTFSVARTSTSWPAIASNGHFAVSLLADGQQPVCTALAGKNPDKFRSLEWEMSAYGTPHIHGSLGWIDCTLLHQLDGGDHHLIIAAVRDITAVGSGDPLIFHGGRLGSFRETTAA
ncbi:flavin reductase family protein [Streptomyces malaysiensis]|uniref:flavin reductase family protein n=1 Tax=Streptomyces malaysiensis TaxID=92644 RepID=UPI0033DAE783